jgi:membrane-anchored protein YejM (alkaline phosphatase superfamily)
MLWQALGYLGDFVFVLAHFLLSTKRLTPGFAYQFLQITAAIMLGVSGLMLKFYPITALEIIWISISLFAIWSLRTAKTGS